MSAQHRKNIPIWLLLGISALGAPTIALAEVHVAGTAAAVHVTADKDDIPEDVLSAFETPFNLRYRTAVPLDGNVSNIYSGSLAHVISRLLEGYDYVIAHDQGTIEIVVSGKRGEASAPVQRLVTSPNPRVVTAQGPQVSTQVSTQVNPPGNPQVSSQASPQAGNVFDPKTYATCMALFHNAVDCVEMTRRLGGSAR